MILRRPRMAMGHLRKALHRLEGKDQESRHQVLQDVVACLALHGRRLGPVGWFPRLPKKAGGWPKPRLGRWLEELLAGRFRRTGDDHTA